MSKKEKQERSLFSFVLVGFLVCVFIMLLGALVLLPSLRRTEAAEKGRITIPSLVGTVYHPSAIPAGLSSHLHYRQDTTLPEGTVLSQSPSAGVRTRQGGELDLVLSTKHAGVRLPDVVGFSREDALRVIDALGLSCEITTEVQESQGAGTVLATYPEAGTLVFPAEGVTIVICQNKTVSVPNVVGMPLNEAILILERAGLAVGSITRIPHLVASETVLSQSVVGRADVGTSIDLMICA